MAISAAELMMNGQELTNEQLLVSLRDFYDFEPSGFSYTQHDFFDRLEETDITFLMAKAIERFGVHSKDGAVGIEQRPGFMASIIPINSLMSSGGREISVNHHTPTTAVVRMDYFGERFGMSEPESRIILPVDSDFHFDRSRRTTITYLNKWKKPYTYSMQAGVKQPDTESGPRSSMNDLRRSTGFLINAIEKVIHSRVKKVEHTAKWLGQAAQWQVNLAWSGEPLSVAKALKHADKLSARR